MTDRELLELAAKAAGINYNPTAKIKYGLICTDDNGRLITWNPLTDDGDALRLAVKLAINPVFSGNYVMVHINATQSITVGADYCDGCLYAATRHAIVRAAAEIGKQK